MIVSELQPDSLAFPELPGGHGAHAGRETDEKVDKDGEQQTGDPAGRQRVGTAEMTEHGAVGGIVQFLQQLCHQHGQSKG